MTARAEIGYKVPHILYTSTHLQITAYAAERNTLDAPTTNNLVPVDLHIKTLNGLTVRVNTLTLTSSAVDGNSTNFIARWRSTGLETRSVNVPEEVIPGQDTVIPLDWEWRAPNASSSSSTEGNIRITGLAYELRLGTPLPNSSADAARVTTVSV